MNTPVVTVIYDDALAIVTINNPPVNATSHAVRAEIAEAILQTNNNHSLKAVLLTCAGKTFVAGADISEFGKPTQEPALPYVINEIENARIPWLAVVHGTALGGGLEIALACRYRIADVRAELGFPEINLGLIPGAGGTVRLPRLIAMQDALDLITSGKPINALKAKNIGLVDEIASSDLLTAAKSFAHNAVVTTKRLPLIELPVITPLSNTEIDNALTAAKKSKQFAKAVAIDTVSSGAKMPAKDALLLERETFKHLRESDQSKSLRHLFFAERSVSKMPALKGSTARAIDEVGIVGGGTMGTGIASSALLSGFKVILIERDYTSINNAQNAVEQILAATLSRGIINAEKHASLLSNFNTSEQYSSLSNADLVIEAVFEDMNVKNNVFKKLDEVSKPDTILASNTSYLDIAAIANLTNNPSRVVGLHYFSPAHIMKLLEVIRTDVVAPDVLATALAFAKRTGKIAVPSGNCKGFIGNRIMSAYRRTSEYLIEDGALPHEIDSAMKNFGFPMGIFEMQDLAGLDIGWAMRRQLTTLEKSETRYVDIADKLCEVKRFGRKTGSGYYQYADGKTAERDEWVEQLIKSESARKGIVRRSFTEEQIMTAILEQITNEADAILKEGIANSADAIDVVMVNGYGFPRWRGGPMFSSNVQQTYL
ncbi:MAG: 3-hydroxyacyl-CoA dehydrogenase NAD-binding domain-containing protein [Granulosicoccaceae bacterium]